MVSLQSQPHRGEVPRYIARMDSPSPSTARADRLKKARERAGHKSARAAALIHNWPESTYRAHEGATRNFGLEDAMRYAAAFEVNAAWIWNGEERLKPVGSKKILPNVTGRRDIVSYPTKRINVLGRAAGSATGELIMSGEIVDTVACPPGLEDVPDAYAVYVLGDSMEPRYFAGETVFVHPTKPYRKGHFVVVQVRADDDETPHGYVKQFVALTPTRLVLRQFSPDEEIEFERDRVISIHRIVGTADGG